MAAPDRIVSSILTPSHVHPEVSYWSSEWQMLRDCVSGEMEIKSKGTTYLPKLDEMDDAQYKAYLDRAVYFNMVARTITGLVGRMFRRPPTIEGIPNKIKEGLDNITIDGQGLGLFVKTIAEEVFTLGRFGVLLDMDAEGNNPPYLAGYVAENIVNWSTERINGRDMLTEVILREIRLVNNVPLSAVPPVATRRTNKNNTSANIVFTNKYLVSYRVLRLEFDVETNNYVYRQYYYESPTGHASIEGEPSSVFTPTRRGVPFNEIPFVFFGPKSNLPDIEKPPIQDIARLNVSHYRSYAQLEHGRFYTGLPVYVAKVTGGNDLPEYTIGPGVVWLVPADGGDAKILEFNGQGLKFLENALSQKEAQVATLGGRLMGVTMESTAESDNSLILKESNEHALLLNVAESIDYGMTKLIRLWAWWQDVSETALKDILYEVSKSFIFDNAAAREFRAIHAMYKDGVIPVQVLYDYLRKAEVIPDWMEVDEFIRLLDSEEGFPGNMDQKARMEGLPDAKTKIQIDEAEKDRSLQRQLSAARGLKQQNSGG